MAAQDKIEIPAAEIFRVILRVMRQKDSVPVQLLKHIQPAGVRIPNQAPYMPLLGIALCFIKTETAVLQHTMRGQSADENAAVFRPGIVQKTDTGIADSQKITVTECQFVISQGKESRGSGGAHPQEGKHMFLHLDKVILDRKSVV